MKRILIKLVAVLAVLIWGTCVVRLSVRWAVRPVSIMSYLSNESATPLGIARSVCGPVLLQTRMIGDYSGKLDSPDGYRVFNAWCALETRYRLELIIGILSALCATLFIALARKAGKGFLAGAAGLIIGISVGGFIAVPLITLSHPKLACLVFVSLPALCMLPSFFLDRK